MIFTKNSIMKDNQIVMHDWEDLMMKKHAEVVCQNGGDILEIGFGSGDNLVNMSLNKPNNLFIGCDAYYNGCVKLLKKIVNKNIEGRLYFIN